MSSERKIGFGSGKIFVSAPDLSSLEEQYVLEAVKSSWISSAGEFVDKFETAFAKFAGARYALGVSNGTVALHLAMLGLDIRPGDEVIVPSLTYVAVANAVRYVGAEPVFVDIDPETWCMDPSRIEDAITRRTKAIVAVHNYGHPADMDAINHIAAVHGLWVIEDAAEAHGATYKGRRVGALGHIATFSFYGNKIITSGEGGAVTVNDPHLYQRLKTLRGQGMDPKRRYFFPVIGYNFRITNVACAILCAQLERYTELVQSRSRLFESYQALLAGVSGLALQPAAPDVSVAPWMFCVRIEADLFGRSRDQVMRDFEEANIEVRPFFVPLHSLPPYREESRRRNIVLPHTDLIASQGINLPTAPNLGNEEIRRVCAVLKPMR